MKIEPINNDILEIVRNLVRIANERGVKIAVGRFRFTNLEGEKCECPATLLAADNNCEDQHGFFVTIFLGGWFIPGFDGVPASAITAEHGENFKDALATAQAQHTLGDQIFKTLWATNYELVRFSPSSARL